MCVSAEQKEEKEEGTKESAFEALLSEVEKFLVFVLDHNGKILGYQVNEQQLGEGISDNLGDHISKAVFLTREVDLHGWEQIFRQAKENNRAQFFGELLGKSETGSIQTHNTIIALESALGEAAFLVFVRNFTQLRESADRIQEEECLKGIAQMMSGIAHDSRNALQKIQSCVNMVSRRVQDDQDLLKLSKSIEQAVDEIKTLYDEVREYASSLILQPKATNIQELWQAAWKKTPRFGRELYLYEAGFEEGLFAVVDPRLFAEVFRNIFLSMLAVCTDPVEVKVVAREVVFKGASAVQIVMSDNGPQVSEEEHRDMFRPFCRTNPRGAGLGLALVRKIIEAHEGRIESRKNAEGVEFVMTFPKNPSNRNISKVVRYV